MAIIPIKKYLYCHNGSKKHKGVNATHNLDSWTVKIYGEIIRVWL